LRGRLRVLDGRNEDVEEVHGIWILRRASHGGKFAFL
jgi:hypothetical protein